MYGDSAYTGPAVEAASSKNKMKNCIHEKGYRNKPLTQEQKTNNGNKPSVRVRIGLMNLTCNLFRSIQLQ